MHRHIHTHTHISSQKDMTFRHHWTINAHVIFLLYFFYKNFHKLFRYKSEKLTVNPNNGLFGRKRFMFDIFLRYIDEYKMLLHKKQFNGKENSVSNMKIPPYQNYRKRNKGAHKKKNNNNIIGFCVVAFT